MPVEHDHEPKDFSRAFAVGIMLNSIYVVVEATVGLMAGRMSQGQLKV